MYNFCFQDFRSDRILDYAKKAQQGQIQLAGGALYGSGAKNPTLGGGCLIHIRYLKLKRNQLQKCKIK